MRLYHKGTMSEGVPRDTPALKDSLRSRIYPLGQPQALPFQGRERLTPLL